MCLQYSYTIIYSVFELLAWFDGAAVTTLV